MENSQKMGLGIGGMGQGNPGKVFLVYSGIASDVRDLVSRYGIDDFDGSTLIFPTIDLAVGSAIATRGDIIKVAPGHTETLSSATALKLDKAGITIEGLGQGNDRPIITMDTATTTTIPVSAANITVSNIIFLANFADIVAVFTQTTANNFKVTGCSLRAKATNMNFLYIVDTSAVAHASDGLVVLDNEWIEPDTATETMVKMDGDNARINISYNFVQLGVNNNTPALMAIATGKSVFNAKVEGNNVFRLNTDTATGAILITTDQSDNSGVIAGNFAQHADTAAELLVTATSGFGFKENYASGVAGASGYLLPAADS